jgi:membrane peptidoglycan carboxypeptidase
MMRSLSAACAHLIIRLHKTWSREFVSVISAISEIKPPAMSNHLRRAIVAGEDRRFWQHIGIDLRGIARATYRTVICGKLEGASTLEQQLIRVQSTRYEITLARKVREMVFAIALHRVFTKAQIIDAYLTVGYYGYRMDGLIAACRILNTSPATIDITQAASLVARLKYPEQRETSSKQIRRLRRRIEHILENQHFGNIHDGQNRHSQKAETLTLVLPWWPEARSDSFSSGETGDGADVPHFGE